MDTWFKVRILHTNQQTVYVKAADNEAAIDKAMSCEYDMEGDTTALDSSANGAEELGVDEIEALQLE